MVSIFYPLAVLRELLLGAIDIYAPTPKPMAVRPTPKPAPTPKPTATAKPAYNPNFTDEEIGHIVKNMGADMVARLTPHNNLILKHKKADKTLFAFYKREDGYLIRRRLGYDNPFGSGNVLNGGKTLPTIEKAMDYFVDYMEKHPQSLL